MEQKVLLRDELNEELIIVERKLQSQEDLSDEDRRLVFLKYFLEEEDHVRL